MTKNKKGTNLVLILMGLLLVGLVVASVVLQSGIKIFRNDSEVYRVLTLDEDNNVGNYKGGDKVVCVNNFFIQRAFRPGDVVANKLENGDLFFTMVIEPDEKLKSGDFYTSPESGPNGVPVPGKIIVISTLSREDVECLVVGLSLND